MKQDKKDLEQRLLNFAIKIIQFVNSLPKNFNVQSIYTQLIKATTSMGANYGESQEAETKKDFRHKVAISRKEARETRFWLRLLLKLYPKKKKEILELGHEAKEYNLIFNAIIVSSKKNFK